MAGQTAFRYSLRCGLVVIALLLASAMGAHAGCATDRNGEVYCGGGACRGDRDGKVWCSRFYDGGAQTTRHGEVRCGRGQCVKNRRGRIFCSSEIGGAALRDSRGRVRCYGECQPARAEWCEHTRAGSAE